MTCSSLACNICRTRHKHSCSIAHTCHSDENKNKKGRKLTRKNVIVEPPSNVPYEISVCDERSSAELIGVIIPVFALVYFVAGIPHAEKCAMEIHKGKNVEEFFFSGKNMFIFANMGK